MEDGKDRMGKGGGGVEVRDERKDSGRMRSNLH